MSAIGPMATVWVENAGGDLVCEYQGDVAKRSVTVPAYRFPLGASEVASLMNQAFVHGARAKAEQLRRALEVR